MNKKRTGTILVTLLICSLAFQASAQDAEPKFNSNGDERPYPVVRRYKTAQSSRPRVAYPAFVYSIVCESVPLLLAKLAEPA